MAQLVCNVRRNFAFFVVVFICLISSSTGINESILFDVEVVSESKPKCKELLESFAKNSAEFTQCAMCHARPIKLCGECIEQYLNVVKSHDAILETEDDMGHACKMQLINLDRLQIIEDGFKYVLDLWQRGHCDNCFKSENGSLTSNLSKEALQFQVLHNETLECIMNHYEPSNKSFIPSVCVDCFHIYCKMNEFYDSVKEMVGDGNICMDIVDSMNKTRTVWSEKLYCGRRVMSAEVPLLIAICILSVTPVIFYVTARRFSTKNESKVLQQKRLVEHLSFPSTSNDIERVVFSSTSGLGS